ncbi:hypothetical protein [Novosphingobium clariflavum]|uniref:Mor transcription activator domain-containing protein n=1 Tax=Novosphingobium clariflavum TaxID=2029884 RepID=A0ABV6SED1_9SPHN|nr:hypothetical protein [Novosphingobium clariflavum]
MVGAAASSPLGTGSQVLDDIAEIIGEEAAFALALEFRGERLYIPKDHKREPRLAETIGEAAALHLCDCLYRTWIKVPYRVVIYRMVVQLADQKVTKREIANRLKIREAQVYAILAKHREANQQQLDLFN